MERRLVSHWVLPMGFDLVRKFLLPPMVLRSVDSLGRSARLSEHPLARDLARTLVPHSGSLKVHELDCQTADHLVPATERQLGCQMVSRLVTTSERRTESCSATTKALATVRRSVCRLEPKLATRLDC